MFSITQGKGFMVNFENGYTVSVQFGYTSFCSNHGIKEILTDTNDVKSIDAETCLINPQGELVDLEDGEVQANRTPAQVLELLNYAANLKKDEEVTAITCKRCGNISNMPFHTCCPKE